MRKESTALLVAALVASGCASNPPSSAHAANSLTTIDVRTLPPLPKPTMALPHPTFPPCVYPTSPADLADLATESDLVVEATIEPTLVLVDNRGASIWRQPLEDVTVVRARSGVPTDVNGLIEVQQDGEKRPGFWMPGRYLLFLLPVHGGTSQPANGMFGMFAVQDGKAVRYCPHIEDPAHPLVAPGPAPTLARVIALIPDPLPPRP